MSNKTVIAIGASLAVSFSGAAFAGSETPFQLNPLNAAYAHMHEGAKDAKGRCGAGRCGADHAKKKAEGKCGKSRDGKCGKECTGHCGASDKKADGQCGASGDGKKPKGQCGAGKCGSE